jgi:ribosomal protein S12 methylthiotransferase
MKRPGAVEKTLDRIQSWRDAVHDLTLRSTFIVGFPGETDAEFEELLDFLKVAQLDRVGCFKYSPVEGAAANELPDAVPEELKEERLERFMEVQAEISAARLDAKIGREIEVIVDEEDEVGTLARSHADAPEIDGVVYLEGVFDLQPGTRLKVRVEEADEHDLWASPV